MLIFFHYIILSRYLIFNQLFYLYLRNDYLYIYDIGSKYGYLIMLKKCYVITYWICSMLFFQSDVSHRVCFGSLQTRIKRFFLFFSIFFSCEILYYMLEKYKYIQKLKGNTKQIEEHIISMRNMISPNGGSIVLPNQIIFNVKTFYEWGTINVWWILLLLFTLYKRREK